VLDRELEVPRHSDASFGVCLLTATAIGWYGDVKEAVRSVQSIAATVVPVREHVRLYNELFDLYTEVTRNTAHISHRLARL
jgi:xylulokinase